MFAIILKSQQCETHDVLPADHLVAVVLLGQHPQAGLNDASSETQHQMESRLCNRRHQMTTTISLGRDPFTCLLDGVRVIVDGGE